MAREWGIRNIYYYLVCLVTLFLAVGGFISAVNSAAEIILPGRPNVPLMQVYYPDYRDGQPLFEPPALAELKAKRKAMELQESRQRIYSWRQLLNAIALIIIPLPFYLYHWRQVKPAPGRRLS